MSVSDIKLDFLSKQVHTSRNITGGWYSGVTEFVKVPNRGHALTIDHGWREVAQIALDFVKRFVPAKPS